MKFAKLSALILAAAALTGSALGQTAYASRFHTVNAGVLVLFTNGATGGATVTPGYYNDAPHVWNNLDQDLLVKPASWNFENPTAPSVVTAAINARWGAALGTPIRKDNAAYWEVDLGNLSDDQLGEYDVLAMPVYRNLLLRDNEAARLRKYMDNGGTLWVDLQAGVVADIYNGLPLPLQTSTSTGSRLADFLSPLMNRPYNLTMADIRASELTGDTTAFGLPAAHPVLGAAGQLSPVVLDGSLATVGVSQVGNGYLVVTTRGVARVLNQGVGDPVNNTYQAKDVLLNRSTIAAGKLVINAISLNSGHGQVAQGSRANHGSVSDLGAPLLPSFNVHDATLGASGVTRPPVFYKGLMVVTTNDTLLVYSAKPGSPLDGSGTLDYGLTDYSLGTSYDLIWKASLTSPISSPACIEVAGAAANSLPKDQILVVDGNGALQAFDAFQLNGSGRIKDNATLVATPPTPAYTVTPTSGASARTQSTVPNAPTYHEGAVYISDAQAAAATAGRLWMANPATGTAFNNGTSDFSLGGAASPVFGEFSSAPTVGYVPIQDNSGGMDKVAYVPAYQIPGGSGPTATASIYSFWIGVKGEAYVVGTGEHDAQVVGSDLQIPLRAYDQGLNVYHPSTANDPLGLHVSATHSLTSTTNPGMPYTQSELDATFDNTWVPNSGSRYILVKLKTSPPLGDSIRVDYTIDWGDGATLSSSILRGVLYLPDDTSHARNIIGNVALTSGGNMVAVLSQGTPPLADPTSAPAMAQKGGSVYNFTEKGRGIFRLNYRFEAYDTHIIQTNQGSSIYYPEAFTDNDAQVAAALNNGSPDSNGVLPNAIKNLTFTSPPTVRSGAVYITAVGWKNTSAPDPSDWIPVSVLVALKENPDPPVIYTGDLSANFQIVQPDICASDDKSNPTHFSVLQPNQYTYSKDPGSPIGILTLTNLMDRDNGSIGNALSTNQPLLLRQAGVSDQVLEPNQTAGSTWNPMLWYAVFPGYHLDGASLVTGDTLFNSGWSVLPGLLNGISGLYGGRVSSVVAYNTAISAGDSGSTVADPRRPWMSQAHVFGGGGSSIASSNLLWPTGITDAASVGTRVGQEALVGSQSSVHVTGGDGSLAVTGDAGLYAFDSSSIIVADASRVARFSPAGDALWSTEATFASATLRDQGGASGVKDLVTPTRAYPFKSDTIIVDTGANRVIRMADTGRESRSIDTIQLDPAGVGHTGFRPDGFQASEPTGLNRPGDVAAYAEYVPSSDPRLAQLNSPSALEYWVHYLIADTGNHRLIDVIDRLYADPSTGEIGDPIAVSGVPQVGVLFWHSPSNYSGKNWAYNSVSRTQVVDTSGSSPVVRDVIAAGIGNSATSSSDLGLGGTGSSAEATGNGSIVLFDNANTLVINQVSVPGSTGNIFWNGTTYGPDSVAAKYRRLGSLTSVTLSRSTTNNYPLVMYTDSSGAYEVAYNGTDWVVRWMMPSIAYTAMRGTNAPYGGTGQPAGPGAPAGNPVALHASFARRLDEDHVLLVNGLVSNDFKGEIVIVSGTIDGTDNNALPGFGFNKTNLGFGTNSVRYRLQDVRGARGIQGPVFADRR